MRNYKIILLGAFLLCVNLTSIANEIQVRTFDELINSHPNSGDTIEILDDLVSDSTIGYHFYGLDITFQGQNHSIDGGKTLGGFVLNKDSLFNQIEIANCKGQEYNRSNFAGAIYNSGGNLEVNNSIFNQNFADSNGVNFAVGGALYNLNGGQISISDTKFFNNYSYGASSYGGAIANGYLQGQPVVMTINNSILNNNNAIGSVFSYGGAIYNNGNLYVKNSQLNDNYSQGYQGAYVSGGAIYNEGDVSVNNSTIDSNKSVGSSYSVVSGGAINNSKDLTVLDSNISNNQGEASDDAIVIGGAIYNTGNTVINNSNLSTNKAIVQNRATVLGGAIYSNNNLEINNSVVSQNLAKAGENSDVAGGAIYNLGNSVINNSDISNNTTQGEANTPVKGGAIYNASSLVIENSNINNNSVVADTVAEGGAIYNNTNGVVNLSNSNIENNTSKSSSVSEGGAIYNLGKLIVDNTVFKNNYANNNSNDIYNANGEIEFVGDGTNSIFSGISGNGVINKAGTGYLNLGGNNENYSGVFNFSQGTLNLMSNSSYFRASDTVLGSNTTFNMQNGTIDNINFGNLTVNGQTNFFVDANLSTKKMDTISASSLNGSGVIYVKDLRLEGTPEQKDIVLPFANSVLKADVKYTPEILATPIYNYKTSYDSASGDFNFIRQNFNSSIFASEVSAQLGGYFAQLETYKNVFSNLDMLMVSPNNVSKSMLFQNKYADLDGKFTYSPIFMPEQRKGIWFKPFSTFESVSLKNGPKVSNVLYGGLVGGESNLRKLKHNWYNIYGAYASYNGSHQAYQGNSIYNNGGLIGLNTVFYKGNFYSAWTMNVGANVAESNTEFGKDDFAMLNTGVAQKSGYNFMLFDNKFVVQPSILTSYSFVNVFNYTTNSGVSFDTKPLHALHIEPGVKFIGNFKNYLQPYLSVSMAWNLIDHAQFQANDVYLPDLSVKPYVQYGLGVQKRWGEKVTGFIEGMIRNGGRNGIALLFGLRISI